MAQEIKPFSAQDCIDFINQHRSEIVQGVFILRLEDDWLSQFPEEILSFLARYGYAEERVKIASFSQTPIHILQTLSRDDDDWVREAIAANANTPKDVLQFLARDGNEHIREPVAANPNTAPEILEKLSKDYAKRVRVAVAKNPNTDVSILEYLAKGENISVLQMVGRNPKTPVSILEMLVKDSDNADMLLEYVASNPNAPASLLEEILEILNGLGFFSRPLFVEDKIAKNPNTPTHVLKELVDGAYRRNQPFHERATKEHGKWVLEKYGKIAKNSLKQRGIDYSGKPPKSACFIATTICGSPLAPEVVLLKEFRDKTLLPSFFGSKTVNFYYYVSPQIAVFLSKHPFLCTMARYTLIEPLVQLIRIRNSSKKQIKKEI